MSSLLPRVLTLAAALLFLLALPGAVARADVVVQLSPSPAAPQPVGTTVTWTASATDTNAGALEYRFSVQAPGGAFAVVRGFTSQNTFEWTPSGREGTYNIRVTVRNKTTAETAQQSSSYVVSSRVSGSSAVVTPTSNPLVALYSAPGCAAGSMRVRFWRTGDFTSRATPWKSCTPGVSMNFYVAGMLAASQYSMRHEVSSDPAAPLTAGPTLTFTTGTPPLTFPAVSVVPPAPSDPGQDLLLYAYFNLGVPTFNATDLSGRLMWYYDRAVAPMRPCDGGSMLTVLNRVRGQDTLREIDLAGNTLRETSLDEASEQIVAQGGHPITTFHHEARCLPDGSTAVLASTERVLSDVQGPGPVTIIGDMIVVFDTDWQVTWWWDAFDHLDVTRKALLDEKCPALCPTTAAQANDWTHANAIAYSPADGNLLLSLRHQDWVLKIDYSDGAGDGDIIWRLGKDGDFTMNSADPYPWFSHQHDANFEIGTDDTIVLYDNGNVRQFFPNATANSRGQVVKIDEATHTATLLLNADLGGYSFALGSAQKLSDGNYHFVSGLLPGPVGQSIEVGPDGVRHFALQSPLATYRSYRMKDLYTVNQVQTDGPEEQSIIFDAIADHTYGDPSFNLSATASSGLPVGFRVVSGPATVSGNTVTVNGAGTVVVQADQDGNIKYEEAPAVRRSFVVNKANTTITLGGLSQTYDGTARLASATTNPPGLTGVSITYKRAGLTVASPTNAGSYDVTASLTNDNYKATDATGTLVIAKSAQTITFAPVDSKTFGDPDFAAGAVASSGLAVGYVASGNCTVSAGTIHLTGAGSCTVTASQAGDSNYNAAANVSRTFTIAKGSQTITFDPLGARTFGDPDFTVSATSSSGLSISFSAADDCTVKAGKVHLTGAGTCTITASQAGSVDYNAAVVSRTFDIARANQTITFAALPDKTFGNAPFTLSATASSGLPVSFSVTSGPASLSGNTLTITGAGSVTVRATQAGNVDYNAAPNVERSFNVARASQTITFAALVNKTFGDSDFAVSATSSSGLAVSFAASGNCTLTGGTVHLTGAGSCAVTTSQTGDSNYSAAADVQRTFNVAKADQTITFAVLTDKTFGDSPFDLSASSSAGQPVSFSIVSGPASISGNTLTINGAGNVTVRASQSGNANYNAAPAVDRSFNVAKSAQTITFAALAGKTFGDVDFAADATASSGLAVALAASGQCTVSGSAVRLTAAGTCTVTASQAGDSNYNAAAAVGRTFQVAKAETSAAVSSSVNPAASGQPLTLTATVTSAAGTPTGTVQFKADGANLGSPQALSAGGVAALTTSSLPAGTHAVTADYGGDANFKAASGALSVGQVVGSSLEFKKASYAVGERDGSVTITVRRAGDTSQAVSVDYSTDDGSVPTMAVPCSSTTGLALARCDYTRAAGRLQFAAGELEKSFVVLVNDDSYVEGAETLSLRLSAPSQGAALGAVSAAALEIADDLPESSGSPIDDDETFVRQQYRDFLGREADADGLKFWTDGIKVCGADAGCREVKRIDTSAAFFLSIEFQETGFLAYCTYKTAFGDATSPGVAGTVPVVRLNEFLADTQRLGQNVVVNTLGWEQRLANNKQAYLLEFVQRPGFTNAFSPALTAQEFVTRLDQNAGGVLTDVEKTQLISSLGPTPGDASKRAAVLRQVAENAVLKQRETNRAFVLMQFYGYLRRNPDDAPEKDLNFAGWKFWLDKLESFGGDYRKAEMVKAFVASDEYRRRFGQ